MVNSKIIQEWLEKADEDFEFASSVMKDSVFYAQICFHFHQASEKYLKAFIVAHELEFKKIHDLSVLLKTCLTKDSGLQTLPEDCQFLNGYYIETRYPVHWPTKYTRDETLKAKIAAQNIRDTIKNSLVTFLNKPTTNQKQ